MTGEEEWANMRLDLQFFGGRGASKGLTVAESKRYKAAVESADNQIKGDSVETAIVLDKYGNEIFRKSDNSVNSIYFTADESAKMKDATFIHNHPGQSTFSYEDVDALVRNQIQEMRATSTKRTYALSRMKNWDAQKAASFASDFYNARLQNKAVTYAIYAKLNNDYRSGRITYAEFNSKMPELNEKLNSLHSDWLKKHAKDYGYRYSITK